MLTAKWEVLVTSLCFLVSMLIPDVAVRMFTNDPELVALSSRGLRIMNSGFALVGFGMVSSNLFQCLGMVRKSIFLSLSRQLLFLLPLIYTLPLWMQEKGVCRHDSQSFPKIQPPAGRRRFLRTGRSRITLWTSILSSQSDARSAAVARA